MKEFLDAKINQFDERYIHNNIWKSDDESMAYAPVEGMRQWIYDSLEHSYLAGRQSAFKEAKEILLQRPTTDKLLELDKTNGF